MRNINIDKFCKICYIYTQCAKVGGCSPYGEVMTMVTYEGIFMFITTLTCVVTLVLDIIDRRKK